MKKTSPLFKFIKSVVRFFYPPTEVVGAENLPEGPCIVVGNHAQVHGPLACELYFPGPHYTWCAGEMMNAKEVPEYAYRDFWSGKPVWIRWFFRIVSYVIAPLAAFVFSNADCIGVYRDTRIITTYRKSIRALKDGAKIIIFPECYEPHNDIVSSFQERFVDLASMYFRQTGKQLSFVPMYVAPDRRELHFGKPVPFDPDADLPLERSRVCGELMDHITALAKALPEHTVVPYANGRKRDRVGSLSGQRIRRFAKPPVVDYRQLRPRLIFNGDPRFSHLRLLGGWVVYFALYFLTENLIPQSACHIIHCRLDDLIPFNEYWLIFYCAWYVWIIGSLLYFLLYDIDSFKRLQTYLMIVQAIAVIVYIVYPSIQQGRPESFEHSNIFTWLMGIIYNFDTPTGVCPSLHVAYSIAIASVWCRRKETLNGQKILIWLLVVMISLSTAFVKQHSVIDIAAAIPVCICAEYLLYGNFGAERPNIEELLKKV